MTAPTDLQESQTLARELLQQMLPELRRFVREELRGQPEPALLHVDNETRTEALCAAVSAIYGDAPAQCRDWWEDKHADAALRLALAAFVPLATPVANAARSLGKLMAARAWSEVRPQRWGRFEVHRDPITSGDNATAWVVRRLR